MAFTDYLLYVVPCKAAMKMQLIQIPKNRTWVYTYLDNLSIPSFSELHIYEHFHAVSVYFRAVRGTISLHNSEILEQTLLLLIAYIMPGEAAKFVGVQ